MYLNLQKISNSEYRLDPTPESIALCDWLNENLEWNGIADWEVYLEPGQLFIDGLEVTNIFMSGTEQEKLYNTAYWYPHHSRYTSSVGWFFTVFEIHLDDKEGYRKGTIRVYNDD